MERRYEVCLEQMLAQAEVSPESMRGLLKRLETFAEPFAESLTGPQQRRHAAEYMTGASLQARTQVRRGDRLPSRPATPGLAEVRRGGARGTTRRCSPPWHIRSARTWAKPMPCSFSTPRRFPRRGPSRSACAAVVRPQRQGRQLPGRRLHGLRVAQGTGTGQHASVSFPGTGRNPSASRRPACPGGSSSAPATNSPWRCSTSVGITSRTAGSPATTRWAVRRNSAGNCRPEPSAYLLAVPLNTLIRKITLEVPPPEYAGRGRHPMSPFMPAGIDGRAALPEDAWARIEVRDGEKGPLVIEVVTRRVHGEPRREVRPRRKSGCWLTRERQADSTYKHDYYLSNAGPATPLGELCA